MLRQLSRLEVKVGERIYQLSCEPDSPLGEIHDALLQMKGYVVQRIVEIQESEKKKDEEKKEE